MKTILRVAKTELRVLFYSPIAWFLLIVFMVQCAIVYMGPLGMYAKTQDLGGRSLEYMSNLTERIFFDRSGLFGSVMQNLYLYIPLLTMGLISRETGSGTIKLLYSSPIKIRDIIFGKYLAMVAYSLLLVAIISIFVVSGMLQIQFPETGMLLTSLLGFFLLLCAYSAIGLFMSTLTTYQIVAAICTFVMIGILSYIGTLWQRIEFVRELTYFLAINGRTQKMLAGLVTTKDVIYFLVIVYIFVGLSIYKLKAGTESKPFWVKASRYAAVIASALLIGYISTIPGFVGYYDATNNKARTLTPQVQKVLADLGDDPLEVTAYNNLLGNYWWMGSDENYTRVLSAWEPYLRFKTNIKFNKTVKYYDSTFDNNYVLRNFPGSSLDEIATKFAKSNEIDLKTILKPAEIRKLIDLRPELNRYVMQLKWKGRTTNLRVYDDMEMWPGETEVAAAFKRLQQAKLPKVGFLTGNLERNINKRGDRDYKIITTQTTFRYSLMNQGFDVDTVSLDDKEVPADISTLVIADPKLELSEATVQHIRNYIDKGGNLIIAGEPGKQSILNPLLKTLGVQLMEGSIIQANKEQSPELVTQQLSELAGSFTKAIAKNRKDSFPVSMPGVSGLSYVADGDFNIRPLLSTDPKLTWNRIRPLDKEMALTARETDDNADDNDEEQPKTVAAPAKKENTVAAKPVAATDAAFKDRQAKAKALQNSLNAIMQGEGTQEEKQQKVQEMMAKANKDAEASLTPAEKKRSDSVRNLMDAIRNGAGTPQEKQQKMIALMTDLKKASAERMKQESAKPSTVVASQEITVANNATAANVNMGNAGNRSRRRQSELAGTVTFSAADGDTKGPFPTVLALTRQRDGKEQRIIISGDADFMSNGELSRMTMRTSNFNFNTGLFSWLNYGEFPIDATRPAAQDKRVKVTPEQVDKFRILYIWVMPAILLIAAAVLLIRRKRK